ncbi:hypothetical protein GCM10010435_57900 [Winogradskya consettensis]|uniref:Regulator component n=1 Tax=Winogradskya consettensis TaxID=113560 RepID=A0A919S8G3_9ACTN|nr:hypothetical protein [Actinoplanes consettensis]GIM67018.1 hypothetical protein Aco04nite_04420 [Actinoplanes consettensis]
MRGLRRRCEQRLAGLAIPTPFDLDAFAAVVAAHRGRPLTLRPMPGLGIGAPCGLWISLAEADYVFYDPGTSRLHAEHIVLHELAHMLSEHSTGLDLAGGALGRLVPDLDPKTVERVLGRVSYTTAQEREAEMLASIIRARATSPARNGGDSLGRLAEVLKFRP